MVNVRLAALPSTALCGSLRLIVTVSSPSSAASLLIGTLMLLHRLAGGEGQCCCGERVVSAVIAESRILDPLTLTLSQGEREPDAPFPAGRGLG